jgi:hypothetical protein
MINLLVFKNRPQLIYGGKQISVRVKTNVRTVFISHKNSEKHWANGSTLIEYLQHIVTPFVDEINEELNLPVRQKALAICQFSYALSELLWMYVTTWATYQFWNWAFRKFFADVLTLKYILASTTKSIGDFLLLSWSNNRRFFYIH